MSLTSLIGWIALAGLALLCVFVYWARKNHAAELAKLREQLAAVQDTVKGMVR